MYSTDMLQDKIVVNKDVFRDPDKSAKPREAKVKFKERY
jgi:hypothetical protein